MPTSSTAFRPVCGTFCFVFMQFMSKREMFARKMFVRVVTLRRNGSDSVVFGCLLSYLFWCLVISGDVELNPGPLQSQPSLRQTRLGSRDRGAVGDRRGSDSGSVSDKGASAAYDPQAQEPSLAAIMAKLTQMDTAMAGKLDDVKSEVQSIRIRFGQMEEEVEGLKEKVGSLVDENRLLEEKNSDLGDRLKFLERKVDDLEGRSRRNNLLFYGIPRDPDETNESCEDTLKDLLTDKLELAEDVQFDRLHRVSSKANSPLIACCSSYKDKIAILKAKRKLKGTDIFIGEDYSHGVRVIRKKLSVFKKEEKRLGKQVSMVYDHLIVDGDKMYLSEDGERLIKRE